MSGSAVTGVGAGFKEPDEAGGDWCEYSLPDEPAGTLVNATMVSDPIFYTMTTVTLQPRAL